MFVREEMKGIHVLKHTTSGNSVIILACTENGNRLLGLIEDVMGCYKRAKLITSSQLN